MKKIHIGGVYYGLHNIGDEAILSSIIDSFKEYELSISSFGSKWILKESPNVEIRDIKVDYVKPKFGLFISPKKKLMSNYYKLYKEEQFYKNVDAYICGGATILSDCPWYSLRTVQLACDVDTPVLLWGVGMAELNDDETKRYIKKVLNLRNVKRIFTRDQFVRDRLIDLGVNPEKIDVCYDPAIMIEASDINIKSYLTESQLELYNDDKPKFVFSLSGESDVIQRTPLKTIVSAIRTIINKYDANLFLIPTGCGEHCKDRDFLKQIDDEVNDTRITVISAEFSPQDLVTFLARVDVIISSRLHLNILGACAAVPSIGLVRNTKIIDFATLMNLPYLELEDLKSEEIVEAVDHIFSEKVQKSEYITSVVKKMKEQYLTALNKAKELIEHF